MDGWVTWVGVLLIVFTVIVFDHVLPEHGDPWSKRNNAKSADEKPYKQAKNGFIDHR